MVRRLRCAQKVINDYDRKDYAMAFWAQLFWRVGLGLCLCLTLAFASSALGHSSALTPTPDQGEVVSTPPSELRIPFDGPMRIITTTLTREDGKSFDVSAQAGRSLSQALVVVPPTLPNGRYTLAWRGLSEDGHTMTGELAFEVDA